MNRTAKILCLPLLLPGAIAFAQPGTANNAARAEAMQTTIIYKHVDENGRVTYANSPIKGGVRVDLDPITVIPSTPSGSLNAANAQAAIPPAAVAKVTPASTVATASVKPVAVATVLPVSSVSQTAQATQAAQPTPIAAPLPPASTTAPDASVVASVVTSAPATKPGTVTTVDNMAFLTQLRRAETQRKLLEGELQTEENLRVASQAKLDEERQLSNGIRAMRATFSATAEGVTPQKPLMTPETRAEIERHFERVRNLQDEVAMHESQVQSLREKLAGLK